MPRIPGTTVIIPKPNPAFCDDVNASVPAPENAGNAPTRVEPANPSPRGPSTPIAHSPMLSGLAAPTSGGVTRSSANVPAERTFDFENDVYDVLETQPTRKAAAKLGNKLQELSSPEERAAFVKALVETVPSIAVRILSDPSQLVHLHGDISRAQRDIIAQSLGEAFDTGAITKQTLGKMLDARNHGPHSNPSAFAQMVARSGSPKLMKEASMQMLSIAENDSSRWNNLWAYNVGAAVAASGSPEAANHLINHLDSANQLVKFSKRIRPKALNTRADTWGKPVLGNLLKAASQIQPPTAQTDKLFDLGTKLVDGERSVRSGLAAYFTANTNHTTDRLGSVSGDILTKRATLVRLSENVLCAPEFRGQKEAQQAFSNELRRRVQELQALPTTPTTETRVRGDELARELGSLIGGLEVGFRRALKNAQDENEVRQSMAGMLFDAVVDPITNAVPFDLSIPGVGSLKGKTKGWVKAKLLEWVKKEEPSAKEMVRPFYQLALQIPGDHTDELEAIAGRFHDNELLGLLDE